MAPTVETGDRLSPLADWSLPVVLVLDNIRSAFNVGNMFRLAEATRAEGIVSCGYTASPPHAKLARTARGCEQTVPSSTAPTAADAVRDLRRRGYIIYGVETIAQAQDVYDVRFTFPGALVLGNEALGVATDTLAECDAYIRLPCYGRKNSVNVGNCAAVVLYQALHQWRYGDR